MSRQYLARDPETAQRKIRRGDYRDMERADRDLEELENTPETEGRESCPQPVPGSVDPGGVEKNTPSEPLSAPKMGSDRKTTRWK